MSKKKYIKIEYSVLFLVLLVILLLWIPLSTGNAVQANFISKWNEKFNRVEYMFSVINAHVTDDMIKSMKNAKDTHEREQILLTIIKPYMRINTENTPLYYNPRYLNGIRVWHGQKYYFSDLYYAENNTILGIKNIHTEKPEDPLFMMMFDINGKRLPNRWGRDIYGIYIYDNGRIEPFGFDMEMDELHADCSKAGTGISCSYYYKIGGGFDD